MNTGEDNESVAGVNELDLQRASRVHEAFSSAEAAEAEAAAAEARAKAVRDRAIRLRRQAAEKSDQSSDYDGADLDSVSATGAVEASETGSGILPRRRWQPARKTMAAGAAIIVICISLAFSGYVLWADHTASQKRQRSAEFAAAARQDVMTLMTLDFKKTKEDMQRISDNSTGVFKERFPVIALQLTNGLERSKVVTTASVNDVAVESMTDNSAVVLVAATTQAKSPDDPQPDDNKRVQSWHIVLTLQRDNGR